MITKIVLIAFVACIAAQPAEDVPSAPWAPTAAVLAKADTQSTVYDDAPSWNNGANCGGSFLVGTQNLADYIKQNFPGVSYIGGYSCRQNTADSSKTSVHGTGRAIDIMIPTISGGYADNSIGDPIGAYLIQNSRDLGVQYVIWDRKQWTASRSAGNKFRDYTGPVPHYDHLHVELTIAAANRAGYLPVVAGAPDAACKQRQGTCVGPTECSNGDFVSNLCPSFGSSIRCCVPRNGATPSPTTKAPTAAPTAKPSDSQCLSALGTCISTSACTNGKSQSGLCPTFPNDVKCCIPNAPTPAPTTKAPTPAPPAPTPKPSDPQCTSKGGSCINKDTCTNGQVQSNLCPSFGYDIKCCVPNTPTPVTPSPAPGDVRLYVPQWTPSDAVTCTTTISGRQGECLSSTNCPGANYNGLCPGNLKCCVPDYTQVSFNPNVIPFDLFQKSFEGIGYNRQQAMWPFFNKALEDGNINTCLCKAAFIAQVGHESGGLRYFEEIASGEAYNNRKDLGNGPTDGPTYKGRGPIQLTGKTNYQGASTSIGVDLVADPERVCMPSMGFKTTIYFWNRQNLNQYCQNGGDAEFKSMTKSINGGYNGLDERMARYADARARMGC